MICNNCGKENIDDSAYCSFCGCALKNRNSVDNSNVILIKSFSKRINNLKTQSIILFAFGIATFLAEIIVSYLINNDGAGDPDAYAIISILIIIGGFAINIAYQALRKVFMLNNYQLNVDLTPDTVAKEIIEPSSILFSKRIVFPKIISVLVFIIGAVGALTILPAMFAFIYRKYQKSADKLKQFCIDNLSAFEEVKS